MIFFLLKNPFSLLMSFLLLNKYDVPDFLYLNEQYAIIVVLYNYLLLFLNCEFYGLHFD